MAPYAWSGLINGVAATVFGLVVFFHSPRDARYRLFLLLNVAIAVWSFGYWQWLVSADPVRALGYARLLSLGAAFIPVFYGHWSLSLIGRPFSKVWVGLLYGLTAVFALVSFSPLFVVDVRPVGAFLNWPVPGPLYHLFVATYAVVASAILVLLAQEARQVRPDGPALRLVFWGSLLGFAGGFTNFPYWYQLPIPPIGNFLVVAYVGLFAYAMVRSRLMLFRGVLTELTSWITLGVLLLQLLLARNPGEVLVRALTLILVSCGVFLLIRSVLLEMERRQQVEGLAGQLQVANSHLQEMDRTKSEFVSIASHELRTPVAAIKGYLSMLLDDGMGQIDDQARGILGKVFRSTDRLGALVEDLLNVSRIESGHLQIHPTEFSLPQCVTRAVDELSVTAAEKGLDLAFVPSTDPIPAVYADPDQVYRVLINILGNAIKYTPRGWVRCWVTTYGPGQVLFTVADSGVGIPASTLPHLFEKFYRAERPEIAGIQGTGLGLYVCKKTVELMGGQIWVTSEPGQGAVFYVAFATYIPALPLPTPRRP